MLLTETLDPAIAGPASRFVVENNSDSICDAVEQLAGLRFAIVLSARWESAGVLDPDDCAELRTELCNLRSRYNNLIDHIAMKYGVQAAMAAQEGVEREVTVPKNMAPPRRAKLGVEYDI